MGLKHGAAGSGSDCLNMYITHYKRRLPWDSDGFEHPGGDTLYIWDGMMPRERLKMVMKELYESSEY